MTGKLWMNPGAWFSNTARDTINSFGQKTATKLKAPPVEDTREEVLRWGQETNFNDVGGDGRGYVIINDRRNDDEKNNDNRPQITYDEATRQTSDVRVENPDDANQYVTVRRINSIRFRGSDGFDHIFNLNWENNA